MRQRFACGLKVALWLALQVRNIDFESEDENSYLDDESFVVSDENNDVEDGDNGNISLNHATTSCE